MEIPTYEQIRPYIEKKLVSEQAHPEDAEVRIFNYTQHCQFEQAWDDVTRQCRGLILNVATGECLARPFPKFFNYGEHVSKGWAIPTSQPKVYEKLDGSLGILYCLNQKEYIATRGSFTSEQAIWATQWWRENRPNIALVHGETHLFEVIAPWNRIVVNYDFQGLVYLATIDLDGTTDTQRMLGMREAREIPYTDMETLAKMDEPNSEGFVLFYPAENVRMKIKFPEYVRLHKLVTGLSEIAIWEYLREGKDLRGLVEKVPDEFFRWVGDVSAKLITKFDAIDAECYTVYQSIKDLPTRKEQALAIMKDAPRYSGIIFAMLDKHDDADGGIWKLVRPHGRSQFKVDIDS